MKNKRVFALSMAALLCASSMTVFAKSAMDAICGKIEDGYYGNLPQSSERRNDSILEGSHFISGTAVKIYEIPLSLEGEAELDKFIGEVEKDSLFSRLDDSGKTCVQVTGLKDPVPGTAIVNELWTEQVLVADKGFSCRLNMDKACQNALTVKLDLKKTNAYFTVFNGLLTGILFTDGKNEMVQVMYPSKVVKGKLQSGDMLTKEKLIRFVRENAIELIEYEKNIEDLNENIRNCNYNKSCIFLEKSGIVSGKKRRVFEAYAPPTGGETASSAAGASMGSVWDKMEAGYYRNLPVDPLIPGIQTVPGTAVRLYRSAEFLGTKNKAEDFIRTVEKKGIIANLVPDVYLSLAGNAANPRADTIIVDGEHRSTILPWDGGACYRFDLSNADREMLRKSGLDLKKTKAYFIELNGLLTGIVFTDGAHEMVQVKQPGEAYPGLEAGKVCTPQELIRLMREQMDRLPADEGTVGWAGTDKPDPAVGETDNANVRTEPFANVWEKLEDVYYKEEPFRDPDRVLPSGGHMIPHTTVHVYTVRDEFNLETGEGLDAFLETAEKRGLLSALSRTGCYTQAEIPASPDLSTLYVDNIEHSVIDVYPGDKGERCRLNLENPTKAVLGLTGINLMRANAHYFTLPEILTGTLFTSTDGDLGEWVQVREAGEAAKGILRPGEWYTAGEFVQLLRDHRAELIGGDPSMPPKSNPIT